MKTLYYENTIVYQLWNLFSHATHKVCLGAICANLCHRAVSSSFKVTDALDQFGKKYEDFLAWMQLQQQLETSFFFFRTHSLDQKALS